MTVFGLKFYISDLALMFLAIFYLPLVLWGFWKVLRTKMIAGWRKATVLVVAVLLAYAIPLGDVTINSLGMREACERAGLHVYRQVAVEGYIDSAGGALALREYATKYPYRFLDQPIQDGKFAHHERMPDGSIVTTVRDQSEAEYEVIHGNPLGLPGLRVGNIARGQVRHRKSGEVLGEWLTLGPRHGWIDSIVLLGWFGQGLPGCPDSLEQMRQLAYWRQQILLPKFIADR